MNIEEMIEQILDKIDQVQEYLNDEEVIRLKIELLKAMIEYEKIKNKNNAPFKNSKTRKIFILKKEE